MPLRVLLAEEGFQRRLSAIAEPILLEIIRFQSLIDSFLLSISREKNPAKTVHVKASFGIKPSTKSHVYLP